MDAYAGYWDLGMVGDNGGTGLWANGDCSLRFAKTPVDIQQECAKLPLLLLTV
jgi:hypothetical protein